MLRQWSVQSGQAPGEPAGEELWEQEMERLCSSRVPVRTLPYAMADRRILRCVSEAGGGGGDSTRSMHLLEWEWKTPPAHCATLPGPVGRW